MSLIDHVSHRLDALAPAGARCLVAVSGGPDSLVLWDLLVLGQEIHKRELVMGHVDHGIDPRSAEIMNGEGRREKGDGRRFLRRSLQLGAGTSETIARGARRSALREMMIEVGAQCVVLGHQADDQAETILLRLLRGSGPAGLAGMAPRRGIWIRPLLNIPRVALAAHLHERGIEAWTDPANSDPRHLRSWLRTEILPALAARLPDVADRLRTAGRHAAKSRRAWDELPQLLPDLSLQQEKGGISVAAPALKEYSSALRHALLGTIGRRFGVLLGDGRLRALDRLIQDSPEGGIIDLAADFQAELAFGRIYFRKRSNCGGQWPLTATERTIGSLGGQWPLTATELIDGLIVGDRRFTVRSGTAGEVGRSGWSTWLTPGQYLVRRWRSGDKMRPLGGRGARTLGILLKEAKIAPSQRREWPVMVDQESATIVWVPGICRAEGMVPQPGATAVHVECHDG